MNSEQTSNNSQNQQLNIAGVMRSYYFKNRWFVILILDILCMVYIQLNQPVRVRRRDFSISYIEWLN